MIELRHIPSESSSYEELRPINLLNEKLRETYGNLPITITSNCYSDNHFTDVVKITHALFNNVEKLFLRDHATDHVSALIWEQPGKRDRITTNSPGYGLILAKLVRDDFTSYLHDETMQEMPALATDLKQNQNNDIKLHFNGKKLVCQTNSSPKIETFYKLKVLEWTLLSGVLKNIDCSDMLAFCKAFYNNDLNAANVALNKLVDFKEIKKKKFSNLNKYFKSNKEQDLNRLEQEINNYIRKANEYQEALAGIYENLRRDQDEFTLKLSQEDAFDWDVLLNYLMNHPYITDIDEYSSTKILIHFEAPITYYDAKIGKSTTKHFEHFAKEVTDVLLDDRYTLWTQAGIILDTYNFSVQNAGIGNGIYIGHPHIDKYSCFGSHRNAIEKWIRTKDYFGVIEQLSAAMMNLNFADGVVISRIPETIMLNMDAKTFYDNEKKTFVSFREIKEEKENGKTEANS